MNPQNQKNVELCFEFGCAIGRRLAEAERLLRWLVQIHEGALTELDVAYDGPARTLVSLVRLQERRFGRRDRERIGFWVACAGGRVRNASEIPAVELEAQRRALSHCDVRALGVNRSGAARAVTAIAIAAGLDADPRSYADDRPTLQLDIGGPGWDAVRWNEADGTLFIPAQIAPPLGDPLPVIFRTGERSRVAVEWVRVVEVRATRDASPGRPAGFALGLDTSPRDLRWQIARSTPTAACEKRVAPGVT